MLLALIAGTPRAPVEVYCRNCDSGPSWLPWLALILSITATVIAGWGFVYARKEHKVLWRLWHKKPELEFSVVFEETGTDEITVDEMPVEVEIRVTIRNIGEAPALNCLASVELPVLAWPPAHNMHHEHEFGSQRQPQAMRSELMALDGSTHRAAMFDLSPVTYRPLGMRMTDRFTLTIAKHTPMVPVRINVASETGDRWHHMYFLKVHLVK